VAASYVALEALVDERLVRGTAAFMAQGGRRLVTLRELAGVSAAAARIRDRRGLMRQGPAPRLAFGPMPNVGPLELVVVLIIALVVLGPKRLPEVGRSLGNGIREFKESLTMDHSDDDHLDVDDVEEPPKSLTAAAATAPAAPAAEAAEPADAEKPQSQPGPRS